MENDINNNSSGNGGNNGNRGKFTDRLKKMRRDRLSRGKVSVIFKNTFITLYKVVFALPMMVYTHITDKDDKNKKDSLDSLDVSKFDGIVDDVNEGLLEITDVSNNQNRNTENIAKGVSKNSKDNAVKFDDGFVKKDNRVKEIRDIDVSFLKKNAMLHLEKQFLIASKNHKETVLYNQGVNKIQKLQKEIIDLIKKRLIKNINEMELLQSELYVLSEITNDNIYLNKCEENVKNIKKLLSKVKALKEKYDHLKDNVDFEYLLEFGDDLLIDKILELKELCSKEDLSSVVDNYKILDEYKFLYLKIDQLESDSIKYQNYKSKQVEELKERDIDFEKLKEGVYDFEKEQEKYDSFVKQQEALLQNLEEKISDIDSYEEVTYRLKGFNQLLGNSFKYIGLLLVNPLKGLIPGIATQTVVTKNLIQNLYNNLEWQEDRKTVYKAIDYSNSIGVVINNLDDMSSLINSTLDDVVRLKNKYIREFSQYEKSFPNYKESIRKINKIQNAVLGSKIKVDLIRSRMKVKEKENQNKMKKVKKMNSG